jgi:hypothetical protein
VAKESIPRAVLNNNQFSILRLENPDDAVDDA